MLLFLPLLEEETKNIEKDLLPNWCLFFCFENSVFIIQNLMFLNYNRKLTVVKCKWSSLYFDMQLQMRDHWMVLGEAWIIFVISVYLSVRRHVLEAGMNRMIRLACHMFPLGIKVT